MAKQSCEEIKDESRGLRGKIVAALLSDASHFEEPEYQLLKFHGSYQQDNRDSRSERRRQKIECAIVSTTGKNLSSELQYNPKCMYYTCVYSGSRYNECLAPKARFFSAIAGTTGRISSSQL